ncbi:hypothetical protein ACJX0J_024898, partial [Zea mays]
KQDFHFILYVIQNFLSSDKGKLNKVKDGGTQSPLSSAVLIVVLPWDQYMWIAWR